MYSNRVTLKNSEDLCATINVKKRDIKSRRVATLYTAVTHAPARLTADLKFFKKNACVLRATYPLPDAPEDFFGQEIWNTLQNDDIQTGEVVHVSGMPANVGPDMCTFCQCKDKTKEKLVCEQCKLCYYCDRECQKKDWKKHKAYCVECKKFT